MLKETADMIADDARKTERERCIKIACSILRPAIQQQYILRCNSGHFSAAQVGIYTDMDMQRFEVELFNRLESKD